MSWYPTVTSWQVSADMTNIRGVPDGRGHNYANHMLDGWAAIAAPAGWTPAATERVRRLLAR